jgi:hypothetical protein
VIKQLSSFNYLGCNISYLKTLIWKENCLNINVCVGQLKKLKNKTRKETQIRFCNTMAVPVST